MASYAESFSAMNNYEIYLADWYTQSVFFQFIYKANVIISFE